MHQSYFSSWFSRHFNHLTYLGMWTPDNLSSPALRNLHVAYRALTHFLFLVILTLQMLDLYFALHDFQKITFNLSTSCLVMAVLVKMFWISGRRECVDELRFGLWRDFEELDSEEDVAALEGAHRQLNFMYVSSYTTFGLTMLTVFFFHFHAYTRGSTELPFGAFLPVPYLDALLFEIFCAIVVCLVTLEGELVAFCLILQIIAHYDVLTNRLNKLNELFADADVMGRKKVVSSVEKKRRAREIIKYCTNRHLQLMEYTYKLEYIYSRCMVIQLLLGSFLIVMNGIEVVLFSQELSMKLSSQLFLIFSLVNDLLLLCHYYCKVTDQCANVGTAVYSTVWYNMDEEIKKGLYMMMIRSNKPPKLTAGNIILIDLRTYMNVLRNILSWLMLIRQLVSKDK